MVVIVGLTGGIASGKSSVASQIATSLGKLEKEGLEVVSIDGDKLGHLAYATGAPAYHKLIEQFGAEEILVEADKGGEERAIDRRKLGGIAFSSKDKMDSLCAIVWPVIRGEIEESITKAKGKEQEGSARVVIVLEAAVMLEAKWEDLVTGMLIVTFVDRELAMERLVARNSLSKEEAFKRIDAQMSNTERLAAAGGGAMVSFEDNGVTFMEEVGESEGQEESRSRSSRRITATLDNGGSEDSLKEAVATIVDRIDRILL
jgi:dephospho-CoA kinase